MYNIALSEIELYFKPMVMYKVEMVVSDTKDGKKIEIYERDEYEIKDDNNNVIDTGGSLILHYTLYTSEDNKINFIEHNHNAITNANKNHIIRITELIGVQVIF